MADPLSLTLAAITLASALKEMVELAQAIDESFEKVSRNRRELRSLVSEIQTTVFQLKKFSDDHYDVLCDAADTKHAILGLITDMRTIYDKCRGMAPPVPPNTIRRLKLDVKAWLNHNRIEEDIKNLRNRVDKCHSQFMIFAVMRIENHLIVMKRQTDERPNEIHEEISTLRPSNDKLIAFTSPNTRTFSRIHPETTAELISNSYLCLQIKTIDDMMTQLSSTYYPVGDTSLSYQPVVAQAYSDDKNSIQQKIIFHSLEIQSYLRKDSQNMSILTCSQSMVDICVGLCRLHMFHDAFTSSKWIVNIFRALAQTKPKIYLRCLASSLCLFATVSVNADDFEGSVSAIEEAIEFSRGLQSSAFKIAMEFQIGGAIGALATRLGLKERKEESLKAAQRAVDIYKNAISKFRERTSHGLPIILSKSPLASLLEDIPLSAIIGYGQALMELSSSLHANHRPDDAYKTGRDALDVLTFSLNRVTVKNTLLEFIIAFMLFRISHQEFHGFISLEEALSLSERGVATFRCFYQKDAEQHGISLCAALCQQANILEKLERWDEALVCYREIVELTKDPDILADQLFRAEALKKVSWSLRQLNRHDEASSIRMEYVVVYSRNKAQADQEAHGYYDLGVELRFADRRPDAINALQSALTRYRALAFKNPGYTKNIGRTLNQLTMNLIHCKEFDQAFNEGYESLKLHERILETDSSVLAEYILAVQLNSLVAEFADNEEKCIERARYCIMCARDLSRLHPTEGNLLFSQANHQLVVVLFRYDRVSEAAIAIQEALEWHDKLQSREAKDVEQYIHCLNLASTVAFAQGYIKKSAEYLQKSIDVGKPHSSHKSVSSALVGSMYRQIQFLCVAGQYPEAVEASRQCVDFARNTEMDGNFDFICCLQHAALVFNYHGNFKEAIDYIHEALQLSYSADTLDLSKNMPTILLLEGESLTSFSEILADAGQEAEALVKGKAAVDNTLGLKSKFAALPWSYIESTYLRALGTYSIRLAAKGDLFDSLDRLVEVRSHYEKQIDSRLAVAIDLACVLEVEGMVCCAAGRLDDGAAAVAKLRDLQNRVSMVHPELAKYVEIALESQRAFPSTIALVRKLNLKCNHEHQKSLS